MAGRSRASSSSRWGQQRRRRGERRRIPRNDGGLDIASANPRLVRTPPAKLVPRRATGLWPALGATVSWVTRRTLRAGEEAREVSRQPLVGTPHGWSGIESVLSAHAMVTATLARVCGLRRRIH